VENRPLVIEKLSSTLDLVPVMRLSGPVVLSTLSEFQSKVFSDHSHNLILDISNVPYMDSSRIGALVALYVRQHRSGHPVYLLGATERVQTILKVSRVDQFFRLIDTLGEAQAN
jgi:anti-sigma B factor antagonist